jgi:hypothetical protein
MHFFTNKMQLTGLNYYASILHALSSVGVAAAFYSRGKEANFDTSLYSYKIASISNDDKNVTLEYYEVTKISTTALESIIAAIFLITSCFHTFYATDGFGTGAYLKEIKRGYNRYRWIEYAITSTMMIFVLAIISGIKDYDTIYELCVLNAVLMSLGYFLERGVNKEVKIVALTIGFTILITIFVTLFRNFYARLNEVDNLGRNLPEWLNYVLFPMFFWWLSFGIVAILNVANQDKMNYDFSYYERLYIYLSFLSKANMGYYLAFGLSRDQTDKD